MRAKKQHLKKRPDGRFACRYRDQWFYGYTEEEALQAREDYKHAEKRSSLIRNNPTVREYSEHWLPISKAGVSNRTYYLSEKHIKRLNEELGDMLLAEVRPTDIKALFSKRYINFSDDYIRHARCLFSALFAAAVDDGIIRSNPVQSPAAKPHRGYTDGGHRAITPEERRIIETLVLDHPMHTAAILMLYAGLRPQETKAFRMEDVDESAGVIHVRHFVKFDRINHYKETDQGKTKKATRDVPLFPPVAAVVKGKHGLILSGPNGGLASVMAWRRSWESYRRKIEEQLNGMQKRWYGKSKAHKMLLDAGKPLPPWKSFNVVPYDLRHSFAAWCRDNGVEINTVVGWMGHADATMILKIYDEVSDSRSKSEAEKLIKSAFGSQNGSQSETDRPPALDK